MPIDFTEYPDAECPDLPGSGHTIAVSPTTPNGGNCIQCGNYCVKKQDPERWEPHAVYGA